MSRVSAPDPRWTARARRARVLRDQRPHAAPLLDFYLWLLELQASVCDPADATRWLQVVSAPDRSDLPRLRLERLPFDELSPRFDAFCRGMPETAPEPIARAARVVLASGGPPRTDLLGALLGGTDFQTQADALGCDPAPLAFLSRGFLAPIAEQLSDRLGQPSPDYRGRVCPLCGWPPQVSVLNDEPDAQGTRRLVCAFCAAAWVFSRSICPGCGVSGDDGLQFHVDDAMAHVRVEECRTCRRYLKAVDLRVFGLAVPLVDDLATVELDLWAAEQNLEKIAPNLLGL